MNAQQVVLGIVLFLVFWAYQVGYAASLGGHAWFAGAVIFVILLWLIYRSQKKKASADMMALWNFATAFLLVATFLVSYLWSSLGGSAASDAGVVGFWLIVYGAAMFATGWKMGDGVSTAIGAIWLFAAVGGVVAVSPYLHFGLLTGLPYILTGLMKK
jgi:hypothetical protein